MRKERTNHWKEIKKQSKTKAWKDHTTNRSKDFKANWETIKKITNKMKENVYDKFNNYEEEIDNYSTNFRRQKSQ